MFLIRVATKIAVCVVATSATLLQYFVFLFIYEAKIFSSFFRFNVV